jgi:hypothetical protein
MNDLAAMQSRIADIQRQEADRRVDREKQAAANRERVRRWSTEFADLCDQLKEAGMFGRMIELTSHNTP